MKHCNTPVSAEDPPTCILVADEHAARFFFRPRSGAPLTEIHELAESSDFLDQNDHLPERLRRVGGRTMVRTRRERTREEHALLIRRVAARIDEAIGMLGAESLALCAPPHILSLLRDQIRPETRQLVAHEICRDLAPQPAAAIESFLLAAGV